MRKVLFALVLAAGCNAPKSDKADKVGSARQEEVAVDKKAVDTGGALATDEREVSPEPPIASKPSGGHGVGNGMGSAAVQISGDTRANSEQYKDYGVNGWTDSSADKLSTFAADVDTASYTIARRKLENGELPPAAAVRVEEMVNYFKYAYPTPDGAQPFSVHIDVAPSPFDGKKQIVRVGVSTKAKSIAERKNANLVFLVDTSGSMQDPDKLELAKQALRVLVDNLKDGDTVSLVTYAGDSRVVLEPTGLDGKGKILAAIEDLSSGGSTAMASGIDLAYEQAMKMLKKGTVTRVIVMSDGDANVGTASHDQILDQIKGKVLEGVTLSTIGFGMGNYKDEMMEQLADKGNGNAFYVDGISAAKRIFQEQLGSTLEVVAKDVKLQVEFEPKLVTRYRLIGYENRDVADADFRKDDVDGGEIGAGHQVTALYEIEPATGDLPANLTPADLVKVHIRAKAPDGTEAAESMFQLDPANETDSFDKASSDMRFAFAVAAFADVLRASTGARTWDLKEIRSLGGGGAGPAPPPPELHAHI
jgi:Ca-activated chloride channel family protein